MYRSLRLLDGLEFTAVEVLSPYRGFISQLTVFCFSLRVTVGSGIY